MDMNTTGIKDVFTTGEVARICHVAPRTVSKWFDSGKLRGYRIPGSRDRRIPLDSLLAFMRSHGIPLNGIDGGTCRVLLVGEEQIERVAGMMNTAAQYDVRTAANGFEAGVVAQQFRPHVIVLNVEGRDVEAAAICRNIKASPSLQGTRVIAVTSVSAVLREGELLSCGFDACLTSPYTPSQLAEAVEGVTDLTD
jgi:excisionase family DNA binding protein